MRSAAALAATLVAGIVMLAPPTASADHDLTCHPPPFGGDVSGLKMEVDVVEGKAGVLLGFSVDARGAVEPRGFVRVEGGLLRPQAAGSSAQCADANGNGISGLTQAQIVLREGRTGTGWVVHILPQLEMDAKGRYSGTVEICDARTCTRHEVEIRALVTWLR